MVIIVASAFWRMPAKLSSKSSRVALVTNANRKAFYQRSSADLDHTARRSTVRGATPAGIGEEEGHAAVHVIYRPYQSL